MEDIIIKMFEKVGISINKHMIVACHRLNKTKTIVKFANRKDPDLVLESKKKLKGIKFLGFCSNTDEDWNCVLPSSETDNSKNVGASEKNLGRKVHMYQSLCPYYRFLYSQVKE